MINNCDGEPPVPEPKPAGDSEELAASYERKLIEVAEMHGELIEFNERLYRTLMAKDHLVAQMRQELIDLRGPVPGDLSQTSDDPSLSDFETAHRALINVWIPSVFMRGRASNAYHVYQVYIRILDNEWNVYRRYTDFRTLHHRLRSRFPQVDTFNFPPKKAIGNKHLTGSLTVPLSVLLFYCHGDNNPAQFQGDTGNGIPIQYLRVQHQQVLNSWLHHLCVSEGEVIKPIKSSARSWACEIDLLETDAKFVESRRKQLQSYLRSVMNKVIQTLPEFTASPTKENLLQLLPFCMDIPPLTDSGNKPSRSHVASRFPKLSRCQQKETRNLKPQSGDL
ncbi:UNVERIFIED_CONTAM: hypothetical protein FKN15_048352 [Acipenser sinensis]